MKTKPKNMPELLYKMLTEFELKGHAVWVYPIKKRVSLDGHASLRYEEAYSKLKSYDKERVHY